MISLLINQRDSVSTCSALKKTRGCFPLFLAFFMSTSCFLFSLQSILRVKTCSIHTFNILALIQIHIVIHLVILVFMLLLLLNTSLIVSTWGYLLRKQGLLIVSGNYIVVSFSTNVFNNSLFFRSLLFFSLLFFNLCFVENFWIT